jgi:TonB family protein
MIPKFPLLALVAVALPTLLLGAKTPPSPLDYQAPVYPESLVETGKDGLVKITFTVSDKGLVEDPVVKEASEPEFGESALKALKEWRFRPGTEDGKPISMKVTLPFKFTASPENKLNAALGRKVFTAIEDPIVKVRDLDEQPMVATRTRAIYPAQLEGTGKEERVKVMVVIGPDGLVYNPMIQVIEEKAFYIPALIAASQWTFEPPMEDENPVYVDFEMTIWVFEGETPPGRGETGRIKQKAPTS